MDQSPLPLYSPRDKYDPETSSIRSAAPSYISAAPSYATVAPTMTGSSTSSGASRSSPSSHARIHAVSTRQAAQLIANARGYGIRHEAKKRRMNEDPAIVGEEVAKRNRERREAREQEKLWDKEDRNLVWFHEQVADQDGREKRWAKMKQEAEKRKPLSSRCG